MAAAAAGLLGAALLAGCAGSPPQITSLSPLNGTKGVAADEPVVVVFDHPVERASVASRFHVDPSLPGCDAFTAFAAPASAPCHVEWRPDGSGFTLLHPGALFAPDSTYRFTLDPGIRDPAGVANGLDHHWQIQTASAPVVRSLTPQDGSTGVPVDAPLAIGFSSVMQPAATTGAVHLVPAVPGTRIVANSVDGSRYVVLPGRLLTPGERYTLRVDTSAADAHGQHLAAAAAATFVTGGLAAVPHALVLGRRAEEPPSVIELTRRAPDQAGEPAAAATLLEAPRCQATACPAPGALELSYAAASASPAGNLLAVVEHPSDGSPDRLVLVSVPSMAERLLASPGGFPSWSADGSTLAFAAGDEIHLYDVASNSVTRLPDGDPLVAPAAWSADGSVLALPVQQRGAAPHVELADPRLLVRYAVPGVTGEATSPALSPDGSVLALRLQRPTPGTWLVRLRAAGVPLQLLGAGLWPLDWADAGTLVGVDRPPGGPDAVARVGVATGDVAHLGSGPRDSDLATVVADPAGRAVGYLLPDARGVMQAWAMNADGSNPTQLTAFGRDDALEAVAVSLGG